MFLQSRSLATTVSVGFTILADIRHSTILMCHATSSEKETVPLLHKGSSFWLSFFPTDSQSPLVFPSSPISHAPYKYMGDGFNLKRLKVPCCCCFEQEYFQSFLNLFRKLNYQLSPLMMSEKKP
jgi:hypothetical protein